MYKEIEPKKEHTHQEDVERLVTGKLREALAQHQPDAYQYALLLEHIMHNPGKLKKWEDQGKPED